MPTAIPLTITLIFPIFELNNPKLLKKMSKNTFKSIVAILAGLAVVVILSIATDLVLHMTNIMKDPFDDNPAWFIIIVIIYRNIYSALGSYLAARLAPDKPMRHAMILGGIGTALTIVGAASMWHLPPHWYPISLIILALPSAWLGGKIFGGGS